MSIADQVKMLRCDMQAAYDAARMTGDKLAMAKARKALDMARDVDIRNRAARRQHRAYREVKRWEGL